MVIFQRKGRKFTFFKVFYNTDFKYFNKSKFKPKYLAKVAINPIISIIQHENSFFFEGN